MLTSAPIVDLSPQVRAAFDEAWSAIFKSRAGRRPVGREPHEFLPGFAAHYRRLIALPRRTRRSMERRWQMRAHGDCVVNDAGTGAGVGGQH